MTPFADNFSDHLRETGIAESGKYFRLAKMWKETICMLTSSFIHKKLRAGQG